MSLAVVYSRAQVGIEAPLVSVETHLANGLPCLSVVGLPEAAVKESKDRVRAALLNARFEFPARRITINLAPADLPKEGGRFDLPIALGILAASAQLPVEALANCEFLGELGLGGELRPVRGVLSAAIQARRAGRALVLPRANLAEAALVSDLTLHPAEHLLEVCARLANASTAGQSDALVVNGIPVTSATGAAASRIDASQSETGTAAPNTWSDALPDIHPDISPDMGEAEADLIEVRGQRHAKRALEIAAAGGHSLLMIGPPGTGKTMLASRLPGILPEMEEDEALETAALQSISDQGFHPRQWRRRPFRAPHHTASGVALVGGGSQPRPGEISLAHNGVLFLDELPEFDRKVLEVLREPLESGRIVISRAARQAEYPARFQLVAAMNPCPCGYLGHPSGRCHCSAEQVQRYRARLSGPLLDRIDLHIEVPSLAGGLLQTAVDGEDSRTVRERVTAARARQLARNGQPNHRLGSRDIDRHCHLQADDARLLEQAINRLGLSARAYHRVLRVARTIADLADEADIRQTHLTEALSYRRLDRRSA